MFLPQRSYMPLGTLREAVTYPHEGDFYSLATILQALTDAGLPEFSAELDVADNWGQRLSGGQQQRVALVRALLAQPEWLFLDEATASLDPASEGDFYQTLKKRLPNTTIVSIAHRPDVAAIHDRRIVMQCSEDGGAATLV
jgi:putative ATP-binding cassette transporter